MNMFARVGNYGILLGLLLLGNCTQDEETERTSASPVAIAFDCQIEETYGGRGTFTRAGMPGEYASENDLEHDLENNLLFRTGFGLFMGHLNEARTASESLDMMYNQKVTYSFLADKEGDSENPYGNGYWSYSPLKYWPNDPDDISRLFFCAYAPYVESPIDPTGTGITGISENTDAEPWLTYTWADKYRKTVDLMWSYYVPKAIPPADPGLNLAAGTLRMKMRHALARLQINVKVDDELPTGTKVLIEEITLEGKMARTGKLELCKETTETETVEGEEVAKHYPVWSGQIYDDSRIITMSSADDEAGDYCSIDNAVRYIKALPYKWQPAGVTTEAQAALFDYKTNRLAYVFLIPDAEPLNLTVTVKYHKMTTSTDDVGTKTTEVAVTPQEITSALKGNKTYKLNLCLRGV